MITDLNHQKEKHAHLNTRVCIVGGGPAGITLALEFEKLGIEAIMLEGGGLNHPTTEELDLYDAKVGEKTYPIKGSRLRFLGGTTNQWGGWSRGLDDFDMSEKPYFETIGWPIDRSALMHNYTRAAEICEISNFDKSHNGYYKDKIVDSVIDWKDSGFENKFFVFSPPTRFGSKYLRNLRECKLVRTFLHANATSLISSRNKIIGVRAQSVSGKAITIHATYTILAMGGLENPRFLLNNKTKVFTEGIGNHSDWLGRGFMDHPGFNPINLLLPTGLKYKRYNFEKNSVMPVISMTKEALLQNEMNNFCIRLNEFVNNEVINHLYGKNPWFKAQVKGYTNYRANFIFEQSPCKDSRVILTNEKDILGQQKLQLNWNFNERDFRSVEKSVRLLIRFLGINEIGKIQWHKFFTKENIANLGSGLHHTGTTRMSSSPKDGVVDKDCKVHFTEGLYIAGSSVFSHIGFSNPTISIVALAIRLAEHLKNISL